MFWPTSLKNPTKKSSPEPLNPPNNKIEIGVPIRGATTESIIPVIIASF